MNRASAYSILILCVSLFIINLAPPAGAQNQNPLGYDPNQILQQFLNAAQNGNASSVLGQISNFLRNFQGSNPNILQQIGNMLGQNSASRFLNSSADPFENFSLTDAFNAVFNSPQVQQAVSLGETALNLYVQNYLESHGVSSVCYRDLKRTANGIVNNQDWAIRMIDAFGKPGSDLKNYQLKWIGAYEECLAVEPRDYYPTPNGYKPGDKYFSGKYCKTTIKLEKGDLVLTVLVTQNEKAAGPDVLCQESLSLDTKAVVAICILSVLGIMMVLGTLYDILAIQMSKSSNNTTVKTQKPKFSKTNGITNGGYTAESEIATITMGEVANAEKVELEMKAIGSAEPSAPTLKEISQNDIQPQLTNTGAAPEGIAEKILLSFSVYTNGVKILSTHQSAGSLGAVNGIRFLSMAWVILGHSYFFAFGYTENLYRYFMEQQYVWHVMGILYASVSVDSFFALSGLLVAYLTLKELKKVDGIQNFNWFMFFFHRFWRLTPPYMLVLMSYTCLARYLGSGPMWQQDKMPFDECDKAWWSNLLYINNFVEKERCIGWTWYLANDMQFYILSPLLLIPLFYQMIIGGIVSLLFLVATVVTTALIVMNHHYPAQSVGGVPPADDVKYNDNVYIPCYTRMGPYIIGLVTGYILYRTKCKFHMPKIVVLLGWLVCLGICTLVVYGPYTDKDLSHIFTMEQSIAYHSLSRTGWGVAVCWIVFACATGHGGWINELLSWKAFIPLGRLTYCAYLIHPIIEVFYYMSRRRLLYFNIYEVIYMFLPNLVMSYGVAFLVSLAFESPMMGLERAIFKRDRRS